jgi:YVTN family beta-propeller protein
MKFNKELHFLTITLGVLVSFLILTSSMVSAYTFQNVSVIGPNAYITNSLNNTVGVIDTANNTIIDIVPVGSLLSGVAVTCDGTKVYVVNELDNNVSVIDIDIDKVATTFFVGSGPTAFGQFIIPSLTTEPELPVQTSVLIQLRATALCQCNYRFI